MSPRPHNIDFSASTQTGVRLQDAAGRERRKLGVTRRRELFEVPNG
ncbi:hypothetical protein [Microbacterium sp. NPDC087592]